MEWLDGSAVTAMDVIKAAMIHVERAHVDVAGKAKSDIVVDLLKQCVERGDRVGNDIKRQLQIMLWSRDEMLQPVMDVIVEAAKGKLPTRFDRMQDDADAFAQDHKTQSSARTHRWSAYALGY